MTDQTGLTGTEGDVPGQDAEAPNEPKSSKGWLKMIDDAEKAYREYQLKADNIDKQYANLERLASTTRDREMQLFWANISVMAPSCYSRPPVPVVIPRFKNDEELTRVASEVLERSTIVTFEKETIDGEMRLIRDDLVILARGAAWMRLEGKARVCIDHTDRKDWLCEPARKWKDCDWVAKRSWLTRPAAKKRFSPHSQDAYQTLEYSVRKDAESDVADGASKAGIWELWCKSRNLVVWVAEGADVVLDSGPPHLTLEGFFPCPRPAYGTLQRRSLVPVPDILFYKDQLEEINESTARIAALTESVRVRGFYPAGASDVSDAIEAAVKSTSNNTVLIPISNWAGLGGSAPKDMVIWWPIEDITATITALIANRKELIQDVYEITGLSDIMRGQTEAGETLGAQQLKSQYGSIRIKDKQDELTRLARDVTYITAEIMADNFSGETLMEMSQMRLPSDADVEKKAVLLRATLATVQKELPALQQKMQALQEEIAHAQQDPEVHAMAAQNPAEAQKVLGAVQQQMQQDQQRAAQMQQAAQAAEKQLATLEATVTIDKVVKLLRDDKLRPFVLDIETDSTITPDENAAKQQATELVTAVGGYLKNALPLVKEEPESAPMVAETLKFIVKPFRAGRELQGVIDKFAEAMEAKAEAAASAPPAPNPEMLKLQADAKAAEAKQQSDTAKQQSDSQAAQAKLKLEADAQQFEQQQAAAQQQIDAQAARDAHALAMEQLQLERETAIAKTAETSEKHELELRKAQLASLTSIEVARIAAKQDADSVAITSHLEALLGFAQMTHEKQTQAQDQAHETEMAATQQQADAHAAASDQAHASELADKGHEAAVEAAAAKPKPGSAK